MHPAALIKKSKWFKAEAETLLKRSQLLPFLAHYGEVKLTGSYALDLMLNGDIDIYVENPKITKTAVLRAFQQQAKGTFFHGCMFYDFVRVRRVGFPRGYYLGLRRDQRKTKWKIDIWFMRKLDGPSERLMAQLRTHLDDPLRLKILKLKHRRNAKGLSITSAEIYRTVLRRR